MITKLYRIPQETLFGVYNKLEKYEREGWGFEPLLKRWKFEDILGLLPPNTHFMTRESLQSALCVLGGKLELGTTVTTVHNSSV